MWWRAASAGSRRYQPLPQPCVACCRGATFDGFSLAWKGSILHVGPGVHLMQPYGYPVVGLPFGAGPTRRVACALPFKYIFKLSWGYTRVRDTPSGAGPTRPCVSCFKYYRTATLLCVVSIILCQLKLRGAPQGIPVTQILYLRLMITKQLYFGASCLGDTRYMVLPNFLLLHA